MNIGILTYHRAYNYGALLQAYALKAYCKSLGHNVEFIDYWPHYREGQYDLSETIYTHSNTIIKIKINIYKWITYIRKRKRFSNFKLFLTNHMDISEFPKYRKSEELPNYYDLVIFGSDQIWRKNSFPLFQGYDPVYWGNFSDNNMRKIAYAASMGKMQILTDEEDFIKQQIMNFDKISVRELALQEKLFEITGKRFPHVLDPVFLLSKSEWELIAPKQATRKKYIVFYHLLISKDAEKLADRIAKRTGYEVKIISGNVKPFGITKKYCGTAGPLEFLTLFSNAEFIISTSFHGTAFAIIFEKQFFSLGMGENSGRVQSLLDILNISKRLVHNVDTVNLSELIDYEKVNILKGDLLKISKEYLQDSISEI